MRRVIVGDEMAGQALFRDLLCAEGMTYQQTKRQQLLRFGIPLSLVEMWEAGGKDRQAVGHQMWQVLDVLNPGMERMRPDGVTRLGLYAQSIGDVVAERTSREIMDFGCGAWIDLSLVLAKRMERLMVCLVDVQALPLHFCSYLLQVEKINHRMILADGAMDTSRHVGPQTNIIIESTSFEHVQGIRWLFPKLMEALPPGGLFLSNYTRVDWSQPIRDGYEDAHDYARQATATAMDLAYRYEWEPAQDNWDLWERK